ncbi:MAG TPA: class I SAM-dependent methyltransferase [Lacunisphaera sp.]|jgi:SAM-dependent methyltransferase|nr:class I SAM-dependent methyltransferase [Lacunisphaera sp.]HQY06659.1 class I SAM-dependent methyltransferase [Lacunisphaera sp.]
MSNLQQELSLIYHRRFSRTAAYRNRVWQVLTKDFFARWVRPTDTVLDLGCGYGEFINNIAAARKLAMDLNPDAPKHLQAGVEFLHQDCSAPWAVAENSLDVVFTSNFFEHLPDKPALNHTLQQARRALKPGGRLIALGPNLKYLHGQYWDFYDHHVYLTEASLGEAMEVSGYQLELCQPKFLPFTLVDAPEYPLAFVRLYLALPLLWRVFGRQFLVVGHKPQA